MLGHSGTNGSKGIKGIHDLAVHEFQAEVTALICMEMLGLAVHREDYTQIERFVRNGVRYFSQTLRVDVVESRETFKETLEPCVKLAHLVLCSGLHLDMKSLTKEESDSTEWWDKIKTLLFKNSVKEKAESESDDESSDESSEDSE
jgi:hypothetical protein